MTNLQRVLRGGLLVGLVAFASACVVAEPREGYYDHPHHRYYHERAWHDCGDRNERGDRNDRCR